LGNTCASGDFDAGMRTLANSGITMPKSGHLFVYLSNETEGQNVFFDNLVVQHYTGPLSETTDYTSWGLSMRMLESRAFGKLINKEETFQGQRFDDDLGLNWMQFKWRNHDPQIGRFIEIDPLSEKYDYNSTYAFSENKVVAHIELEGLEAKEARTERQIISTSNGTYDYEKEDANFNSYAKPGNFVTNKIVIPAALATLSPRWRELVARAKAKKEEHSYKAYRRQYGFLNVLIGIASTFL
jgi:RHS repeat-associated protein